MIGYKVFRYYTSVADYPGDGFGIKAETCSHLLQIKEFVCQ